MAFIIGILLWRAEPARLWHLTAAAVHLLLGTSNLVFWQIFVAADALWGGYVTTSLHRGVRHPSTVGRKRGRASETGLNTGRSAGTAVALIVAAR